MFLVRAWYEKAAWLHLLRPLAWLFHLLASQRRRYQTARQRAATLPVIVVGNITVGGTGKTPVVAALACALQQSGLRVGVLSRGYGGRANRYPYTVTADSDVRAAGDEAQLLRRQLQGPLVVDPDRNRGLMALAESGHCDVVVCDDGLQHYRLWRDIEMVVIDGQRGLGNGFCLPAGPLREPPKRLSEVDYLIVNGHQRSGLEEQLSDMGTPLTYCHLQAQAWVNVRTGEQIELPQLVARLDIQPGDGGLITEDRRGEPVVAIAGIGNPQRFFASLQALGFAPQCRVYPDHHAYRADELASVADKVVLMTEKDAVKCQALAGNNWWYLAVRAKLDETLLSELCSQVRILKKHPRTARH